MCGEVGDSLLFMLGPNWAGLAEAARLGQAEMGWLAGWCISDPVMDQVADRLAGLAGMSGVLWTLRGPPPCSRIRVLIRFFTRILFYLYVCASDGTRQKQALLRVGHSFTVSGMYGSMAGTCLEGCLLRPS